MLNSEEILVALAIKYQGDWESILCALEQRKVENSLLNEEDRENTEEELEHYLEIAKKANYKYTTILSNDYPKLLKSQYMPPFVLFYYGDLSLAYNVGNNLAVVGSRECSEYGSEITDRIVLEVAQSLTIVSGLAIGVDTIAHTAALRAGGRLIGVLGSGIDFCYPIRNKWLYEEIKQKHLLISEYPGDLIPEPDNFPRRNRIIAMLSAGTLVTEAYARSGTLTTVMYALQCNRLILCVPYLAGSDSECNRLIAEGAYLVQSGNDVLEIMEKDSHIG